MNDKKEPVTPRPGETFCRGDSMCKGPEEATGWVSMRLGRVKTRIGGKVEVVSRARSGWGPRMATKRAGYVVGAPCQQL